MLTYGCKGSFKNCSHQWKDPKFKNKKIANQLIGCLEHCELTQGEVGVTFQSDHVQANGLTSESQIDHVYFSKEISDEEIGIKTLKNSSSDHHPVIVTFSKVRSKKIYTKKNS